MTAAAPIKFHPRTHEPRSSEFGSKPPKQGPLVDQFGRTKTRLRVSLTDRCNLRCPYCMPDEPKFEAPELQLPIARWAELMTLFVKSLGIQQIRLTGGEPLLVKQLPEYVAVLNDLRPDGLERISLTSNGILLPERIQSLKDAGLSDLNISLDALDPDIFKNLSGGRAEVASVIAGIEAAMAADIPIKINMVVVAGINDQEITPMLRWCMGRNLPLRFIEFMPLDGHAFWSQSKVVSETQIIDLIKADFPVTNAMRNSEPASYYSIGADSISNYCFGIIPTVSNAFCADCNRLRLTANGDLFTCLFSKSGQPLVNASTQIDATETEETIRRTVWNKGPGFLAEPVGIDHPVAMHRLGG